ncbi:MULTISPECIES: DUF5615 family PIN-like protein [Kamptonema]|uniref:DUF5615 family PIN-like protein n=1 Tax=Kamptonema TaxID=1501433 RepID=UPI0001DAD11D|nr:MULTISPECIES: DUF5615 family PIN-like protein [Kamptonema]CBN59335.1 conserved hypothetical protein [Kamptonema sp. PCC 6506]
MSQIRLYMDEDAMDRQLVQALRVRGVDAITVGELEITGTSDEIHLVLASELGRVIYTFNVGDFCRLHSTFMAVENSHAGIIIGAQQQYSVGTQLRGVMRLIAVKSAEEMIGQLVFLRDYMGDD